MKIAINAISLCKGGTVILLDQLLSRFVEIAPQHEYHVLANSSLPGVLNRHPRIIVHRFNWNDASYMRRALWHTAVLSRWCSSEAVDVLFSQEYYLPLFKPRHTVLLLQDATFFDDSRALRNRLSLSERLALLIKKRWCYHSVAGANRILVQSDTMARSVAKKVPSAESRISVIHHGPGFLDGPQRPTHKAVSSDSLEIAYVALYRRYKNFEVLLRALRLLNGEGIPVRLHLTLDLVEGPGARRLMSYARKIGVEHSIINHGELEPERVTQVYQTAHVFVFSSVCESFGFPQVEAMAFGLPILAADTAVNRELCGRAAIYFAADDDHMLATQIKRLYQNPLELEVLAKRSARRGLDFDWTEAAKKTMECLVDANRAIGDR